MPRPSHLEGRSSRALHLPTLYPHQGLQQAQQVVAQRAGGGGVQQAQQGRHLQAARRAQREVRVWVRGRGGGIGGCGWWHSEIKLRRGQR